MENLGLKPMKGVVDPAFWKNKKVFLTGHTGFKGSWLSLWLQLMGATVRGYALSAPTAPALFVEARIEKNMQSEHGDIRNSEAISASMRSFNPDVLIHMAAQSLVRRSYRDPVETYSTNVMGTVHVLEAARKCRNLQAIINVTTDKCYENREWQWGYRENEPMGGHDPYSSSKGCAELITSAYRASFFNDPQCALGSARAGNVIGGGDWAEDRLIPDVLRAFEDGQAAVIRNPLSTRPWQHVLEPLSGYLVLAQGLWNEGPKFAQGWNFGPRDDDTQSVEWILHYLAQAWGPKAHWRLDDNPQPHEAQHLKLDISKAQVQLHWSPVWNLQVALDKVVDWHRAWQAGEDSQEACMDDIQAYMRDMYAHRQKSKIFESK